MEIKTLMIEGYEGDQMGNLEDKVSELRLQTACIEPGDKLLIACSGGIDSMVLLHFLYERQAMWNIEIAAIHVDHMLRGEQSAQDCQFVAAFCHARRIPFYSKSIPIPMIIDRDGGNTQAVCRKERYAYFAQVLPQFTKLVTAHHADDQLETMVMAMMKGPSVSALSGIRVIRPFASGQLIRPFLFVTRQEIEQYASHYDVRYREDPSNQKDTYTRNRVRHHIAPLLAAESAQTALHAAQLSVQLQQDNELLEQLAQQHFDKMITKNREHVYQFQIDDVQKMPLALQRRFILILLSYLYKDVNMLQSHALTTALLKLCDTSAGTAQVSLPAGLIARRQYNEVFVGLLPEQMLLPQTVKREQWLQAAQYQIGLFRRGTPVEAHDDVYYITLSETEQLQVRPRVDGDRIALRGMAQQKKVSRLFIDDKVPKSQRSTIPLLVSNERGVLAVIGGRPSAFLSRSPDSNEWQVVIRTIAL